MSSFVPTELYGGAITVELPAAFADVSTIRQVPDNQEVYLERDGFTSVIFDIMERVEQSQAANDEEALKFHYSDMVGDSNDATHFWHSNTANIPAYTLVATQHPTPDASSRKPQPDFTAIVLILVRLAQQKTDIVITVNVPHVPGEYPKEEVDFSKAKQGPLMDAAAAIKQQILQTFDVKDWSLFVNDE
ncbi:ran-interacting Mog1 protein [Phyllosticta citrichinensis]|uniref:Ran-interacting Mog1 protein n=1 Tax=Phyllosticta citrichinensis TaxID=1130410 RepID=A0ABR1Y1X7_9PEZI